MSNATQNPIKKILDFFPNVILKSNVDSDDTVELETNMLNRNE